MRLKTLKSFVFLTLLSIILYSCSKDEEPTTVAQQIENANAELYLTTANQSKLIEKQTTGVLVQSVNNKPTITVAENDTFQSMDGFGFTLTGGSAQLINSMSSTNRTAILNELFGNDDGQLNSAYVRISIGASDLDAAVFSYNDLAVGQTDFNLANFSIDPDRTHLIPVLQEILTIQPDIKILATPWSAPLWMKTNENSVSGSLKTTCYGVYADYFVKYIEAMQAEGIRIDAISVQNEPENPFNNPSMVMTANEQIDFIANHLGPALETANSNVKIIAFDHNPDNINYPIAVLDNAAANAYIDGSAFHLYGGQINDLSRVHDAHPDKNIYFTEQWIEAPGNFREDIKWHFREVVIGATRNWSKNVLEWNLAADPASDPHTPGGCTDCLGALTIDGNNVTRNSAYYIIGHASRFVPVNSVRIGSNYINDLPNVAFKTPEGKIVLIVLNNTSLQQRFNINVPSEPVTTSLPAGAVGTFIW